MHTICHIIFKDIYKVVPIVDSKSFKKGSFFLLMSLSWEFLLGFYFTNRSDNAENSLYLG